MIFFFEKNNYNWPDVSLKHYYLPQTKGFIRLTSSSRKQVERLIGKDKINAADLQQEVWDESLDKTGAKAGPCAALYRGKFAD